jgi:hypothetical protein
MTLAATPIVNSYIGTGSANSYPFSFVAFSNTDITVVVTSPAGVPFVLNLGIDFTVAGLNLAGGPASTGAITLVNSGQAWLTGGNLTTGWTITITRIVSVAQNSSIRNQGDFYQEFLESALDYIVMICQQLQQASVTPITPIPNTILGDLIILTGGAGLVVTDQVTGKQYRITVNNGLLGTQPYP